MRTGGLRSIVFTPPRVPAAKHPDGTRELSPRTEIERLGQMAVHAETIREFVRRLPFEPDGYTGNLRVLITAARHLERHAEALLARTDEKGT